MNVELQADRQTDRITLLLFNDASYTNYDVKWLNVTLEINKIANIHESSGALLFLL